MANETKTQYGSQDVESHRPPVEVLSPGEFGYLGVLADRGAGLEDLDVYGRTPKSGTYLALDGGGVQEAARLTEENGGHQVGPLTPHRISPDEIVAYRPMNEDGKVR